jgi:hypothetical protein
VLASNVPAGKHFYTFESGSSPQYFVNMFSERIARGVDEVVVVAGGEVLVTAKKMGALGKRMRPEDAGEVHTMLADWTDDPGIGPPEMVAVEPEVPPPPSPTSPVPAGTTGTTRPASQCCPAGVLLVPRRLAGAGGDEAAKAGAQAGLRPGAEGRGGR